MERHGLTLEFTEWWHFNYQHWQLYPILAIVFGAIKQVRVPVSPGWLHTDLRNQS